MSKDEAVLVLNACTTPLRYVSWQRAISAVVAEQAVIVESDPERAVRSAYAAFEWPTVIMLKAYVHVPYVGYGGDPFGRATSAAVFARDGNRCAYCGKPGDTIDHVQPKSRGGADTWENQVTACFDCNQAKGNRTPAEAGMKLLWQPRAVSKQEHLERQVKRRANRRHG